MSGVGWLHSHRWLGPVKGRTQVRSEWSGEKAMYTSGAGHRSVIVLWYLNAAYFKCNVLHKYVPSVHNQVRQQQKELCWRVRLRLRRQTRSAGLAHPPPWLLLFNIISVYTSSCDSITLFVYSTAVSAHRKDQLHRFYINGLVSREVWNALNTESMNVFPTYLAVEMHFCLNICERHNRL